MHKIKLLKLIIILIKMASNSNSVDEEEKINQGFKTALFIDVPNWEKTPKKLNNDCPSAGETPDQSKSNMSLISNLISRDLMKKLEEESPAKGDITNFENYFENQYFYSRKLSFDEENEDDFDGEDSETKVSKKSKDSDSSSEKTKDRKSNSFQNLPNFNSKKILINFFI